MFAGITTDLHLTKKHPWKKEFKNKSWGRLCENRNIFPERAEKFDKTNTSNSIATCSITYYVDHLYLSENVQEMLQTKDTYCILV